MLMRASRTQYAPLKPNSQCRCHVVISLQGDVGRFGPQFLRGSRERGRRAANVHRRRCDRFKTKRTRVYTSFRQTMCRSDFVFLLLGPPSVHTCVCAGVHRQHWGGVGVRVIGLGWVRAALNRLQSGFWTKSTRTQANHTNTHHRPAHLSHPRPISVKGPPFPRSLGSVHGLLPNAGLSLRYTPPR